MRPTLRPTRWTCLLTLLACLIALPAYAQDSERPDRPDRAERPDREERPERPERMERYDEDRPERPERKERPERPERAEGDEDKPERKPGSRHAELAKRLKPLVDQTQEFQTDSTNQLKAHVSYAIPARGDEGGYRAFVVLRWGDLDNELTKVDPENHASWDGSLTLTDGTAKVARELAFEDGQRREREDDTPPPTPEEVKAKIAERAEAARAKANENIKDADKLQERLDKIDDREDEALDHMEGAVERREEMREKMGELAADEITSDEGPSQTVTWESGVVGATDGLLIRLDLPTAETTGTVKAGEFEFTFTTTEVPAETLEAWKEEHKPRRPRDGEEAGDGEADDDSDGEERRPRPPRRPRDDDDEATDDEADDDSDGEERRPRPPRQPRGGGPRGDSE